MRRTGGLALLEDCARAPGLSAPAESTRIAAAVAAWLAAGMARL